MTSRAWHCFLINDELRDIALVCVVINGGPVQSVINLFAVQGRHKAQTLVALFLPKLHDPVLVARCSCAPCTTVATPLTGAACTTGVCSVSCRRGAVMDTSSRKGNKHSHPPVCIVITPVLGSWMGLVPKIIEKIILCYMECECIIVLNYSAKRLVPCLMCNENLE